MTWTSMRETRPREEWELLNKLKLELLALDRLGHDMLHVKSWDLPEAEGGCVGCHRRHDLVCKILDVEGRHNLGVCLSRHCQPDPERDAEVARIMRERYGKEYTPEPNRGIHSKVDVPEWMPRLWEEILKAEHSLAGWFEKYTHGFRSRDDLMVDEDAMPWHAPAWIADYWIGEVGGFEGTDVRRYQIGTFAMFRCADAQLATSNEPYKDDDPPDNEVHIKDGPDHTVVVYML